MSSILKLFLLSFYFKISMFCIPSFNHDSPFTTAFPPVTTTTMTSVCPPPGFADIFLTDDVDLINGIFGMVEPDGICDDTSTGKTYYYNGNTPETPSLVGANSAGAWNRANCNSPCLCDANNECFIPSGAQDPIIYLYPHCISPTDCFMAIILQSNGELTSTTNPTINIYTSDAQVDTTTFTLKPVTDPAYLRATSMGCNGCPVDRGT